MWQFIPATGKTYKLQQNAWFDQRRDIVASTGAALDYLQTIYEMHGDWHLALASYNWGENAVARAVNKNLAKGLPTDYRKPEDAERDAPTTCPSCRRSRTSLPSRSCSASASTRSPTSPISHRRGVENMDIASPRAWRR
jgi:hypothetical protein